MNFASDNWAGATDAVMDAIARANGGFAPAYGDDALTKKMVRIFGEIFEREVEVFFVASGTAANTLCMTAVARPAGYILCSDRAHMQTDEFNASEFFTGMKLAAVSTADSLMTPEALEATIGSLPPDGHRGPLAALSLTNASEFGRVYRAAEVAALAAIGKRHGMMVHIDGARFANAVAATGESPADLTWRAGVDLMSFGGTKNGCWAAEAVVLFERGRFPDMINLRQRAGHGLSKQRFIAAQYEGYFVDGNWLKTARHANAMNQRLQAGLRKSNAVRLPWPSEANESFPVVMPETAKRLRDAGAVFHTWEPTPDGGEMVRLVTSFATTEAEVDGFLALLGD
jgi:threonine aldolase